MTARSKLESAVKSELLFALVFFLAATFLGYRLRVLDVAWVEPADGRGVAVHRWDPRLFSILSFGHLPATVDWLWIKASVDPARDKVPKGTHPPYYYNVDLLTDLDPAFLSAYTAAASVLAVIRDDAIGARDLLLKGTRFMGRELPGYPQRFRDTFWSRGWNLHLVLAYVWLFECDNLPEAAAEFRAAALMPGSPAYLSQLAARLASPGGEYEVGLRLINFMIDSDASNERLRGELERKRESLYLSQYLHQYTEQYRDFLKTRAGYREGVRLSPEYLHKHWRDFVAKAGVPAADPWGGKIFLDPDGRVNSTTPRIKVFGLD